MMDESREERERETERERENNKEKRENKNYNQCVFFRDIQNKNKNQIKYV